MMREDLEYMYQGLIYEEGFGPGEVLCSLQRKKLIDTRIIVSVINYMERKEIFGEGKVHSFFDMCAFTL